MITLNVSNQICLFLALFTFGLHWYCGQVMKTLNVRNQIFLLLALFTYIWPPLVLRASHDNIECKEPNISTSGSVYVWPLSVLRASHDNIECK